jgi:2,3-bisphosphoglycerate-independent phosphoglycerate mutase
VAGHEIAKRVLILFWDGVGLGEADTAANPFMHVDLPALRTLLNVPYLTREAAGVSTGRAILLGLDAQLGVAGLPQSATGQTAILTGHNAAAAIGQHYGPYPNQRLREMLAQDNLFKTLLDAGQPAAYANAYPRRFLDRLARGKGRLSANTLAAHMSHLKIRSSDDLRRGRAITALLSNDFWPEPEVALPPLTARQAGAQLARLAAEHTLTFFEFWYPDWLGHKQQRAESLQMLIMFDDFVAGILDQLDLTCSLLLVVSDHGNFEDWTTTKHTQNPALTILAGDGAAELAPRLQSLSDVKSALLSFIFDQEG